MEMMIEDGKYNHYIYEIWAYMDDDYPEDISHFYYKIFYIEGIEHYWKRDPIVSEAYESYDTLLQAEAAARGHIDLLESGEG